MAKMPLQNLDSKYIPISTVLLLSLGMCGSLVGGYISYHLYDSQNKKIQKLENDVKNLQVVASRIQKENRNAFTLTHYNILAEGYGSNLQPWFLYGITPRVSEEQREAIANRRLERSPVTGEYKNRCFRSWTEGILTEEQQEQAEKYDKSFFSWERRRQRLLDKMVENDPDIICLTECDNYVDFFKDELSDRGYESVWAKRPRAVSRDGSCVAWKKTVFKLQAWKSVDFLAGPSQFESDRIALLFILHWRNTSSCEDEPLFIATTHFARNPESREQDWVRARQMHQLFTEMKSFTDFNGAARSPTILTGDLNARDITLLSGIARVMSGLSSKPSHPLLHSSDDALTSATSYTCVRRERIDYVIYSPSSLKLESVYPLGEGMQIRNPIPDANFPSDHVPVTCRFSLRSLWMQHRDSAGAWLSIYVPGRKASIRPLTTHELRRAYTFFDRGDGVVDVLSLKAGIAKLALNFPRDSITFSQETCHEVIQKALHFSKNVDEHNSLYYLQQDLHRDAKIPFHVFVQMYLLKLKHFRSLLSLSIESAYQFFNFDENSNGLSFLELSCSLNRISPYPLDKAYVEKLWEDMDSNKDGNVSCE